MTTIKFKNGSMIQTYGVNTKSIRSPRGEQQLKDYKLKRKTQTLMYLENASDFLLDTLQQLRNAQVSSKDDVYIQKLVRECDLLFDEIVDVAEDWSDEIESE